jgi:hypothetical protein
VYSVYNLSIYGPKNPNIYGLDTVGALALHCVVVLILASACCAAGTSLFLNRVSMNHDIALYNAVCFTGQAKVSPAVLPATVYFLLVNHIIANAGSTVKK